MHFCSDETCDMLVTQKDPTIELKRNLDFIECLVDVSDIKCKCSSHNLADYKDRES